MADREKAAHLTLLTPAPSFSTMGMSPPASEPLKPCDPDFPDFVIPPFPRAPEDGTRLATENMVISIDRKIAKLAALGLRPHPNMLDYRKELVDQLDNNGPYRLRVSSGIF